ncbi:hypothetical protein BU16DRAFT_591788 [Lophium mytilinum]|uniref:F-box domain-containing protein n=1 Tax=Lophium mytilinum TaxID=390894 RepID=A0A6A6QLW8_9PEZI|nr:hypothetical protein BU16DRAFT_591788 [Lophium mytilinum]
MPSQNPPTLLTLPPELRALIYTFLYADLTITHSLPSSNSPGPPTSSIPSTRTALLHTSHLLHHSALPPFLASATLVFSSTESMLTTLLPLPRHLLTKLRDVRVTAFPFPLRTDRDMRYYPTHSFAAALALLPGLQLRRLVVEDGFTGSGSSGTAGGVVTEVGRLLASDGWQELELVTTTGGGAQWAGLASVGEWDRALKGRGGKGASVSVWVAGIGEGREVRLTARRGRGARIVREGEGEGRSWAEVKGKGVLEDCERWYYDEEDRAGWLYGGWSRRMQLAVKALR